MKKIYFLLLSLIGLFSFGQDLIITGAFDGPLTGGTPKGVELYVVNDITDLSNYGLGSANNGGGSDGVEFTFPADAVTAGTFIYVASETTEFANFFGFPATYDGGSSMGINGDDAIELFSDVSTTPVVIDVFGDINTDGSGETWDYLDGWAYRVDGTGPEGSTFTVLNWTYSGINQLENGTTNSTCTSPFPVGTYSTTVSTTPTVSITGTVPSLDYFEGNGPSNEGSFSVSGINLTADITVNAPANFEVSTISGGTFSSSVTLTQTAGTVATTDVFVRLASGLTTGSYSGDITASSAGATDATLELNGMVEAATPQFSVFGTPVNDLNYGVGNGPSNEESIFVEGLFLTSDISVNAPTNFEVSLTSGSGFGSSVTIPQSGGTVANTEVFVRLAAGLSEGSFSGDITVSSSPVADQTVALTGNVFGAATNALVLVGVYDGPLPGGLPKGIELIALEDISDLSVFGVSSVTNGAGSSAGNIEYNFPADAVSAGDRIYLSSESTGFTDFFGFAPTYTDGVVGINGDDAIELYEGSTIIDTFGDVATDGTGEPWDYLDGWAYRVNNTGPDGGFVLANWTFSGANAFDGETTNSTSAIPYPIATYTNSTLSVNSPSETTTFSLYPNPSNGNTVTISSSRNEAISIQVFDILGKQVKNETLSNNTLNVSNLKSGVYIVKITQSDASTTKKLVIK